MIGTDERIDGSIDPTVVELDERESGVYAEVRSTFGTIRSSEEAPDERVDYQVTAYYYQGDGGTIRTEDAEQDPRNGSRVTCQNRTWTAPSEDRICRVMLVQVDKKRLCQHPSVHNSK